MKKKIQKKKKTNKGSYGINNTKPLKSPSYKFAPEYPQYYDETFVVRYFNEGYNGH